MHLKSLVLGYGIKDRLGHVMYGTNTYLTKQVVENSSPCLVRYKIVFKANMGVGSYSVQTALVETGSHIENNYEWKDIAIVFDVVNPGETFAGVSYLPPKITIEMN